MEAVKDAASDEVIPKDEISQDEVSHGHGPIDGKRFENLLEAFQSQLRLQQSQLDLLRQLQTRSPKPPKSQESATTLTGPIQDEIDFAINWMNDRLPDKPGRVEVKSAKHLVRDCMCQGHRLSLWYSQGGSDLTRNAEFISVYGNRNETRGSAVSLPLEDKVDAIMQSLDQRWPLRLGTQDEDKIRWNGHFGVCIWYLQGGKINDIAEAQWGEGEERLPNLIGWTIPRNTPGKSALNLILGQVLIIQPTFNGSSYHVSLDTIAFLNIQLFECEEFLSGVLNSFLSAWELSQFHRNRQPVDESIITILHRIRYFGKHQRISSFPKPITFGDIPVVRQKGRFNHAEFADESLEECRVSVVLLAERKSNKNFRIPCYTIVVLTDQRIQVPSAETGKADDSSSLAPLIQLLGVLDEIVAHVCNNWEETLAMMDLELSITIPDLFDDETTDNLMFDDKLFLKSKAYFRMQQLCRIFGDTIEQTSLDLRKTQSILFDQHKNQLTEYWLRGKGSAFESLCKEWNDRTTNQVVKLDAILERMRKKGEEVISLRDGLFNASSVREAAKSTEMAAISIRQNQYVFVFTVTTVIYLPLGFVTSIFGMHLFDTTDPGVVAAQKKFYITIVVLSIATYGAAFLSYWLVRNRKGYMVGKGLPDRNNTNKANEQGGESIGEALESEDVGKHEFWKKNLGGTLLRRKKGVKQEKEGSSDTVV